jgi:hypothetical protein
VSNGSGRSQAVPFGNWPAVGKLSSNGSKADTASSSRRTSESTGSATHGTSTVTCGGISSVSGTCGRAVDRDTDRHRCVYSATSGTVIRIAVKPVRAAHASLTTACSHHLG